ncbi:MAG TPA: serine/threonine protein kinase [Pyrinomonadaceae bacterium]|nr:serine/threonine protein kinase [Pyrinomonadaceae bacterium]
MSELKLQQCRLDGRYDVLDCLGRGSYSEVYVARDADAAEGAPRTVVIKALNTHLQGVPDAELEQTLIDNFRNEAVALDRVRHPNVINRLGHGTAIDLQGRIFHYLVLEYLPGGDLQALCRRQPLALADALFYLEQVSAGLQHAHDNGVIHRDIKPQNLLLTADRRTVKIADFGVAKIEAAEGAITRVGTDVYAAPEHHPLAHTGPLDTGALGRPAMHLTPAADVYSLAKTAYMLLTGEAPRRFSQKPITELPAEFASEEWASFVVRVLRRATQSNPESRYQSVAEFWDELKDAAMPGTKLLPGGGQSASSFRREKGSGAGDNGLASHASAPLPPAPPAPVFARPTEPSPARPGTGTHQRIIVPIARDEDVLRQTGGHAPPQTSTHRPPVVAHGTPQVVPPAHTREARVYPPTDSRARKWIIAIFLLIAFAGILLATYSYVRQMRAESNSATTRNTGGTSSVVGREFVATTDVNLRPGPTRSGAPVGLAAKDSVVEVLDVSGSWYEVRIKEHGRPKEDPDAADRGWAHSSLLRAKQ